MTIDHSKTSRLEAFTLIEMMVVVLLIAIVSGWAVPGLKRAYENFKIDETFHHINTFASSFESFYLIENEFPEDCKNNYIKACDAWCLPGNYYTRNGNKSEYQLNVKPYQATAYDIDNWIIKDGYCQFYISIYNFLGTQDWGGRLQRKYPTYRVRLEGKSACLEISPGLEKCAVEPGYYRNRFY